ncbi:toxin-antitoxin system YwqK family antitoxin [Mangrovimonas aestuarii]|uniref:toxin-antitoxin system YwqK family antitoxin n=1 Tax=Mangrovimonas aestuarii TaxID=3018443 RepID=UPI002378A3A6|nr:toxin-antitoxin system YwqK family antitoxin [Mangrovimonas aestuarii]
MKYLVAFFLSFYSIFAIGQDINQFDSNGNRHGVWRKNFDKTKVLRYEGQFVHGKEVGTFKFYKNIDGKAVLTATKVFNDKNNTSKVTFLASNGKVISKGEMSGKAYIGEWVFFHKNSDVLMIKEHYNYAGQLEGKREVFYENGQLAQVEHYKEGVLNGICTWHAEDGTLFKEYNYVDGGLHGSAKYYDKAGKLMIEGQYKNNKKHGIWKYYEDGKLKEEKDFSYKPKSSKKKK